MRGFANELARIVKRMKAEAGEGIYIDPLPAELNRPHGATFATPVRGGYDNGPKCTANEGRARGGRPKPLADLVACGAVVDEIIEEIAAEVAETQEGDKAIHLLRKVAAMASRVQMAIRQTRQVAFHGDASIDDDIDALAKRLAEAEKTAESERDKGDRRRWKEWLEADWHAGARRAHVATKTPVEWRPTVVTADDGSVSATPLDVLDATRRKYAAYWKAVERPVEYRWGGSCQPLPRLTPTQLRSASLGFSRRTSSTYDGWHVRHIGLLSDEGLEVLATLLEAIERSSRWPSQTSLVTT